MKQQYSFCEQVQVLIPWPDRCKLAGKIALVLFASINIIYGVICFNASLWMQPDQYDIFKFIKFGSPVPPFGGFDYAFMAGICIGYIVKYAPWVFRGYKQEKWLPSQPGSALPNHLLPERCQVRVTEEVIETNTYNSGNVYPPEVVSDTLIDCVVLEMRDEMPVYGPPEACVTLTKRVVQIILGLFDRLTICLKRSDGFLKSLSLNARRRALVAYLATKASGAKIFPKEMLKRFYYGLTKDSLYTDKSVIQSEVKEASLQLAPEEAPVSLFRRRQGKRDYTELALSPECLVSIPSTLQEEQMFIQQIQEHPASVHHPGLKQLRQNTEEYIRAYGRGFLAHDLEADNQLLPMQRRWSWALPLFQQHRRSHLNFLAYAAWREHTVFRKTTRSEERRACWRQLQTIHRASAFAGTIVVPEDRHSEREIQRFLVSCLRLHDSKEARETYSLYATQMSQTDPSWEPAPRTSDLLAATQRIKV